MSVSGWITVAKVMKILDLNPDQVRRLVNAGRLHPVKLYSGGVNVYRETEVKRLAAEGNLVRPPGSPGGGSQRNALGQFTKPDQ